MNRGFVGQTFLSAGSGDFPVARAETGLESPVNRQAGKPALLSGSWPQLTLKFLRCPISMNTGIAPKDSKRPRIAFLSSVKAWNRWDFQDGSWSQCASDGWKWSLSMNQGFVGQTFLSAGSGDFPVARADTGLESPVNRQAGRPALLSGSWPPCAVTKPWRLPRVAWKEK